jgi:hypothetical protein
MKYERFSQLYRVLVTDRPRTGNALPESPGMSDATAQALMAYAEGDKSLVERVRNFLRTTPAHNNAVGLLR